MDSSSWQLHITNHPSTFVCHAPLLATKQLGRARHRTFAKKERMKRRRKKTVKFPFQSHGLSFSFWLSCVILYHFLFFFLSLFSHDEKNVKGEGSKWEALGVTNFGRNLACPARACAWRRGTTGRCCLCWPGAKLLSWLAASGSIQSDGPLVSTEMYGFFVVTGQ